MSSVLRSGRYLVGADIGKEEEQRGVVQPANIVLDVDLSHATPHHSESSDKGNELHWKTSRRPKP